MLLYGFPNCNPSKKIVDTQNNYAFRLGRCEGEKEGELDITLDCYSASVPANTQFTIQFEY